MQLCPDCNHNNTDDAPTCRQCDAPLLNLLGKDTLLDNRYRIREVLGFGGMGAVYLADDSGNSRHPVAIKENRDTTARAGEQFRSEVKLMSGLDHPGLPRIGAHFTGPLKRQYLVMDYIEGETLGELVSRQGPVSERQAGQLARQLLATLQYLHEHSIVHRDIKPTNIKLTGSGQAVLVDFGISKVHDPNYRTQTSNRGVGSPGFAPIEQYGTGTDARSDIYSLGAVLYYLLTGEIPPESPNLAIGAKLTPPRKLRPEISAEMQKVIFKAMALNPEWRYQSAAEMGLALPPLPADGSADLDKLVRKNEPRARNSTNLPKTDPMKLSPPPQTVPGKVFVKAVPGTMPATDQNSKTPSKVFMPLPDDLASTEPDSSNRHPQATDRSSSRSSNRPSSKMLAIFLPFAIAIILLLMMTAFVFQRASSGFYALATESVRKTTTAAAYTNRSTTTADTNATISAKSTTTTQARETTIATENQRATVTSEARRTPHATPTPLIRPVVAINPDNAARVAEVGRLGKGTVKDVAWSPDGTLLAVGSSIGVHIYHADDLSELRYLPTNLPVNAVAFSSNGEYLAAGAGDGRIDSDEPSIQLWRISGDLVNTLTGHEGGVDSVAFSPNGQHLVSGSHYDNTIRLWQIPDGKLLSTLHYSADVRGSTGHLSCVAFSPDGQLIALGDYDGTVRLWQVIDGRLINVLEDFLDNTLTNDQDHVFRAAFSPDGQLLASLHSSSDTIRLWRVADGSLLDTLESDAITVTFSPDGQLLASGRRVWRVADRSLVTTLKGPRWNNSLAFSPDGQRIVSSDKDTVRLWQIPDGSLIDIIENHSDTDGVSRLNMLAFSPDGQLLASGGHDASTVRLWRVADGSLINVLEGAKGAYYSLAFSPDGRLLAAGDNDSVRLWEATDGNLVDIFEADNLEEKYPFFKSVAFSPDGQLLAAGNNDTTIRLWQINDGSLKNTLAGHTNDVSSLAFSPDGQLLVSGGEGNDTMVRLWRVTDGSLLNAIADQTSPVVFSSVDQLFASKGYSDGFIRFWRVTADGSSQINSTIDTGSVHSMALSPDGHLLASSGSDGTIQLWQTKDGNLIDTLTGHTKEVHSLAFSPDGHLLASDSYDGTIRFWGVP